MQLGRLQGCVLVSSLEQKSDFILWLHFFVIICLERTETTTAGFGPFTSPERLNPNLQSVRG